MELYIHYKELPNGLTLEDLVGQLNEVLDDTGVVVAVNNDDKDAVLNIREPLPGRSYKSLIDGETCESQNGTVTVTLKPNESQILSIL